MRRQSLRELENLRHDGPLPFADSHVTALSPNHPEELLRNVDRKAVNSATEEDY